MQTIFGLDLGVASIGYAVVQFYPQDEKKNEILDCGVRVIPLDTDEIKEFGKGGNVPTNVARRAARGARRNLQRYKLRRYLLLRELKRLKMAPTPHLMTKLTPQELYGLRLRGLNEPLSLPEIGRVLYHLNQRRGYKSARVDQGESDGKKQSDYLQEIAQREAELDRNSQTVGAYLASGVHSSKHYRVRQQIFNRSTYQEEFDQIWNAQQKFHPDVLTDQNRRILRDKIIYRQRPLRSQKGLVGECALEWNYALEAKTQKMLLEANGLPKIVRPKCAPKSSPLAQACKVWESIHNLRVYDETGAAYPIPQTIKNQIFELLQQEDRNLTAKRIIADVLKLSPKSYTVDPLIKEKGLENNRTSAKLLSVFQKNGINRRDLLAFNPVIEEVDWDDPSTGERRKRTQIRGDFDKEPLYQLWHLIYATQEEDDLIRLLQEKYGFTLEQAQAVAAIDFTKEGYASKSHRAMRRLLPHYQNGLDYTAACVAAGYNHSNSLTKTENEARTLLNKLEILPKNSLRNPVVEKILNQMIHLVNDLMVKFGRPSEIRVELARELKQSAKERQSVDKKNYQRKKERDQIRKEIAAQLKIQPESVTKVQIEKWKLYKETNGVSLYTGLTLDLGTFLRAEAVDIEHIIPKVRRFDDSFENKTICERKLNQDKNKSTAYDFMRSQPVPGLQSFDAYLRMVKELYDSNKLSRGKYNRLMMSAEEVSNDTDFIARQLRETQYITKKARQLLQDVCYQVTTTSGSITDFLRHQWGWDEIIQGLRISQFRELELTKMITIRNGEQEKEVIEGWDKRDDHRHHALDALVVACTRQSHIKRLNDLNQTLEGKFGEDRRKELLATGRDKYIAGNAPFSHAQTSAAIDKILISFKQGQRVATRSKNKVGLQITLTPRGKMHEETIYGRIKRYKKVPLNIRFDPAWLTEMAHPEQKKAVEDRLAAFDNDPRKAFKQLDKNPILLEGASKELKYVTIWDYVLVSRKSISPLLSEKSVEKIADQAIKTAVQERLSQQGGTSKEAFKNVGVEPVIVNGLPVKKVRVLNPAEKYIALPRGFAEPGGNHHIAIYLDAEGKKHEHVVTFWDAFQRVRLGLPAIIKDVDAALASIEQIKADISNDLHLPDSPDWKFLTSLAINDMFVFDLDPKEIDFMDPKNLRKISKKLFRVRKLTSGSYWFMHHLETNILEDTLSKKVGRCKQCSISSLRGGIKVNIDRLGNVISYSPPIE
ncbi:MAG TPA: type II CRISPR RNA-guided endonuclease Cas9 [Saprospiraceae bacterium]|nr:type II CRISPR RNA-guided endonuclease Cas9 [Saprospiraceae bacterium]